MTEKVDIRELPDITPQQHEFAFLYGTRRIKTQVKAYKVAYNAQNMSDKSCYVEASRLANDPDIALWIDAYGQAMFDAEVCSKEQHLRILSDLREEARRSGNLGAAVQAEQLRGKVGGHYVEQYRDLTRDPLDSLREIAAHSPALAAQLAKEQGIAWDEQPTAH